MSDDKGMLLKLVILDQDRRILVDTTGETLALPEVTIPLFRRIGYAATTAAREKYGLELFVITEAMMKPEDRVSLKIENLVLICRLQDTDTALPVSLAWHVQWQAEFGEQDRIAVEAAMKEFKPYDSAVEVSSFGRYRSLDDLRAWFTPYLDQLGLRETGIQQWNGDP